MLNKQFRRDSRATVVRCVRDRAEVRLAHRESIDAMTMLSG
jgi:hypothetical protein